MIKNLRDVVNMALKAAQGHEDRFALLDILHALDGSGNADVDPRVSVVETWTPELVDEVLTEVKPYLVSNFSESTKVDILHRAFERHVRYNIDMFEAVSAEIESFNITEEVRA